VFKSRTTRIAAGDLIRITHNGMSLDGKHRLDNGAIYQVKGFDETGNLKLANGWTVGRDFGHFTHGYAVTSFASQGRTVDHVFIAEGQESLPAANNPQFYVSVSRARRSATIYTDDKAALREAVERSDDRITATELAESKLRERVRRRDATLVPQRDVEQKKERIGELVHER
jgi:ATP-dependent exoDNAse (exonuclease V) alpha subunit